ncbi:hypothetical protein [Streptomyces anulatus]|uniref:hypothetical protein n=1 Tax=Streptomyces anulatus TaxID=1892 RepID=UPI002E0DC133|nr:hypothetical protein OG557_39075 [Streptomyces anulatus]
MTALPTGTTLVQMALQTARAVVAGHPGAAQLLAGLAPRLSRQASATYRRSQHHEPNTGSPAIDLMRAAGNSATVSTAGEIRAALATRPAMRPQDYLKSMTLATLPAWPLPDDDTFEVVVYKGGAPGLDLLAAVGAGDEVEVERITAKLSEGPSMFSARGLGD